MIRKALLIFIELKVRVGGLVATHLSHPPRRRAASAMRGRTDPARTNYILTRNSSRLEPPDHAKTMLTMRGQEKGKTVCLRARFYGRPSVHSSASRARHTFLPETSAARRVSHTGESAMTQLRSRSGHVRSGRCKVFNCARTKNCRDACLVGPAAS